jgi:hypothetical protein
MQRADLCEGGEADADGASGRFHRSRADGRFPLNGDIRALS